MSRTRLVPGAAVVLAATLLAACTGGARTNDPAVSGPERPHSATAAPSPPPAPAPSPERSARRPAQPVVSEGRPKRATMTIAALGVRDLLVVPYRGWTDDGPGTRIQDSGAAASPHGPRGGVGPGGVGNYQVTAHRTSSDAAFARLPSLRRGDRVLVESAGVRYVYEIRRTRETSFRSRRSLAEQRAAVPGRPGAVPTRAFVTLSTCATLEDHAAGNYWSDEFHNPEHRIDKVGVLVRTVPSAVAE